MERIPRWAKYVALGASAENDLQHSFSASLLAIIVIETLRDKAPQWSFDPYAVLACVVIHDLGETVVGDTHYIDKTPQKDRAEFDAFAAMLEPFPEAIRRRLEDIYLLQYRTTRSTLPNSHMIDDVRPSPFPDHPDSSREALVFDSIERLGYLLYAYREYRERADLTLMLQVCRHQHSELLRLSGIIPAFGDCFYPEPLRSQIHSLLINYESQYLE
jgi:5'-deoxynucleotidase YfbR-like HD superfamily hydrolase